MRLGLFDIAFAAAVCYRSKESSHFFFQGNTILTAPTLIQISCLPVVADRNSQFGVQTPLLYYRCFSVKETLETEPWLTHWQRIRSAYHLKSLQLPEKIHLLWYFVTIGYNLYNLCSKLIQPTTCYVLHSFNLLFALILCVLN